jgi:hypothetical protein
MCDIKIIYNNDEITFYDGEKLVTKGSDRRYHRLAQNIINNSNPKRYDVEETWEGHKKIVTLVDKRLSEENV